MYSNRICRSLFGERFQLQNESGMTLEIEIRDVSCPFCAKKSPRLRYRFAKCAIVRCTSCDLMWLYPKPNAEQLHQVYDDKYYSNSDFFKKDGTRLYGYVDYLSERINKQYTYQRIAEDMKRRLCGGGHGTDRPDLSWLDVGCGLGFLMDVAFDRGFRVRGVEFNRSAVNYIRSKFTFPVEYGLLSEVALKDTFSVISLFDVIEHLEDPFTSLRTLRQLARPGAYCLIQTMDSDSFVSRLIGRHLEDFRRTREHLFFFTRKSIERVLRECGWDVLEITSMGHTFQLSYLIDRLAVYSPVIPRLVRALIHPKWLLDANVYINPGTKMLVYARTGDR